MASRHKSVAGKTVPGEKRVPGRRGGKTFPKKDQPTKRQRRLATVKNPGADDNEKGLVRGESDDMEWKDDSKEEEDWVPAIYHNEIRGKLLAKASNNGQLKYDHPRKQGFLPNDETAFLLSQQHWGPDRSLWHHIPGDLLNRLDRLDHKGKDYEPEYMIDEETNKIVLDMDNHPVVAYEDIPLVLSSNFRANEEGFLLEAIGRIDPRIERADFLARMPWERKTRENGKVEPLFTLSTIGNREYRWRKDNAVVTWTQRSGSKNLRAYIVNKLSAEGRANNTTREMVNGLTKEEKEEAERPNKGVMMSKAGKRLLLDDVRNDRERKSNKPRKRPHVKRKSTRRKAPKGFDNDVDAEDVRDSRRLVGQDSNNKAGDSNPKKREQRPTTKRTLRKRKAPTNFDDDTDVEDHDSKRIRVDSSNAKTRNDSRPPLTSNHTCQHLTITSDAYNASSHLRGNLSSQNLDILQQDDTADRLDLRSFDQLPGWQSRSYVSENLSDDPGHARNPYVQAGFNLFASQSNTDIGNGYHPLATYDAELLNSNTRKGPAGGFFQPLNPNDQSPKNGPSSSGHGLNLARLLGLWFKSSEPVLQPQDLQVLAPLANINPSLKRNREEEDTEEGGPKADSPRQKRLKLGPFGQRSIPQPMSREPGPFKPVSTLAPFESEQSFYAGESSFEVHLSLATGPTTPPINSDKLSGSGETSGTRDNAMLATADTTPATAPLAQIDFAQDYRFKQPQKLTDATEIEEALDLTRHDFTDLFGKDVFGDKGPPTNYYDSYAMQYAALQKQSASLQPPGPSVVNLDHWGAWTGGFDRWKGTKISKEDFLQGMEVESTLADAEAEPAVNDADLFEEYTTDIL